MKNEMTKELTETLLMDVKRYSLNMLAIEMFETPHGGWVKLPDVEAALTAALDGADERAGEMLERLRKADEYEPLGHDGWEAADLLTALLTANAALRAERDRYLRHLTAGAESLNAYKARAEAAEAEVAKLQADLSGMVSECRRMREEYNFASEQLACAEAEMEKLRGALDAIYEITVEPAETDHKNVRGWIEVTARAALTETATTEADNDRQA